MPSVVREWIAELPFKMQAVLLSALRGCDGKPKEDPSKKLTRALRGVMLYPAVSERPDNSFMGGDLDGNHIDVFLKNLDHYPVHWLLHFAHACEIVGYFHPDAVTRAGWYGLYAEVGDALHLRPETKDQLCVRLGRGDLG